MVLSELHLASLLAWSILAWSLLAFMLGRAVGRVEDTDPEHDHDGGVLLPLAAVLGGLMVLLVSGDGMSFGVPGILVAAIPIMVAYSALLFEVGRGR